MGKLYGRTSGQATPLVGQNVNGLTSLKLLKLEQFMKDQLIQVACLSETWRVTPNGVALEETDGGFLVLHHGQATKTCKRGRNGVAIILGPEARAAWALGGEKYSHGSDGRTLTAEMPIEGGRTWTVGSGYAPGSVKSSEERQAFYDGVSTRIGRGDSRNVLSFYLDANASAGVGVHARDRPAGAPCALGPYGVRHVNPPVGSSADFCRCKGSHQRRLSSATAATRRGGTRGRGKATSWTTCSSFGTNSAECRTLACALRSR